MKPDQVTRHAVLGAGGVGGLMAAALSRAGDDVTLIIRPQTLANFPAELSLESPLGSFSAPVKRAARVDQDFDVLWITVKATELDSALVSVSPNTKIGAIVPLLNGIDHVELLRERFGKGKVVAATIAVESERVAPGKIVHRSPFVRLNVAANGESRLGPVIEKLRKFGFTCDFIADEATLLWSKLVFLAPFALTTSAARMNAGEVLSHPEWRARIEKCIAEACSVAIAQGARVDAAKVTNAVMSLPGQMRSSMQKDLAAGKPPELDAIAGPILRGAENHGMEVPVTRELVKMIEQTSR